MGAALLVAGSVVIGMREEGEVRNAEITRKGQEGEDEAGASAAVSLGTEGVGAGAVIVDGVAVERYRDDDGLDNRRDGASSVEEYRDEDDDEEVKI